MIICTQLYCFFLSVTPPKDLAPFSYISPQKTLFSTIKYELVSKLVKSQKTEKGGPPTNPATTPPEKFVLLLQSNLFITFNEMRVKYYRYCVG